MGCEWSNHEIAALRIRDVILSEQYGEGTIPSNTKTGGGPFLLRSSFTYVRDWINKHPFKNEPNARLICSLVNGAPVTSQAIWQVLNQLRLRIKRLVESGPIADEQQKQKLEYLLRVKKWNPYCFRHSAISDDSEILWIRISIYQTNFYRCVHAGLNMNITNSRSLSIIINYQPYIYWSIDIRLDCLIISSRRSVL